MYAIVLTDGKAIKLEADEVEWCEKTRTIRLLHNGPLTQDRQVARINMDNVVGWIDMNYMAESEDKE